MILPLHARLISSARLASRCAQRQQHPYNARFLSSPAERASRAPLSSSGPLIPGYVRPFRSSLGTNDRFTTRPWSAGKRHDRRIVIVVVSKRSPSVCACVRKKTAWVCFGSGRRSHAADTRPIAFVFVSFGKEKSAPITTTEFAQSAGRTYRSSSVFGCRPYPGRIACTRVLRTPGECDDAFKTFAHAPRRLRTNNGRGIQTFLELFLFSVDFYRLPRWRNDSRVVFLRK